ncbi:hypothetical protein BC833DRAFT_204702 [Globomyces pollinis-pini]|nr:hypothetical protein BC833DRAFT_204702 [Globomyces pollinis-pini]
MKNQNDSKNINDNDVISFSMMDFFDRFVRSANEKGLLRTPLPTPLSRALIRTSSIQLLQAARLDPQDVTLHEDNYGGTITLTSFGLQHIVQFLNFKQQSKAATNIQKVWRGYVTRKKVAYMFANHNDIDPKKQVLYLEQYISGISVLYHTILNAQRPTNANQAPTGSELDFMRKLSHPETYRVCQEYLTLLAQVEAVSSS